MFGDRKGVDMDESGIIYEEDLVPAMRSKIAELEKENADLKNQKEAKQRAENERKVRLFDGIARSVIYIILAVPIYFTGLLIVHFVGLESKKNISKTKSNFASLQPTASLEELKKFENWKVLSLHPPENQVVEIGLENRSNYKGPKEYLHLDPEVYEAVKRMDKIDTFILAPFFEKKKQRAEIASEIFSGELVKAMKDIERLRDENSLMSVEIEKLCKENSSLKSELALARAEMEVAKPAKEKPAEITNQAPINQTPGFLEKECKEAVSETLLMMIFIIIMAILIGFLIIATIAGSSISW